LHEAQADTGPTLPAAVALPGQAAPAATPATTAAETPAAAAPTSGAAAPAAQLAPALLTLAKAMDGSQQMTVRMQPADLGMVQVRIAHAASGGTQIEISAENPATLQALQRDQPQLHRTLDEAGVPVAGRTVTFHVAAAAVPAAAGGAGGGAAGGHSHSQPNSGGRANTGTADADGSAGSGRGSYPARERNTYSTARRPVPAPATAKANAAPAGTSYRIGLDITARTTRRIIFDVWKHTVFDCRGCWKCGGRRVNGECDCAERHVGAGFLEQQFQRLSVVADDSAAEPGPVFADGFQSVHQRTGAVFLGGAADRDEYEPDSAYSAYAGEPG
jgi:hypothetical protein